MEQASGSAIEASAKKPGLARRIVAYPLTLAVIEAVLLVAIVAGISILSRLLGSNSRGGLPDLPTGLAIAAAVILAYKGFKRWLERSPDQEFAWPGALGEFGAGLGIGFALFTITAGSVWLLGGLTISGVRGGIGDLWPWIGIGIYSGVFEETLFRGVLLRQIERMTGTWIALALTAALFGFIHLRNPNSTLVAGLAITMEAGILLGAAYILTRRLWLAIGIHAAWNFTQGWVFSLPVSGTTAPTGLLITSRQGPEWLTGGAFGLEASLMATLMATLAGIAMLALAIRRGRLVRPAWSRAKAVASPGSVESEA
jgi:membrane protease YdiL (CAAX protease family)